MTKTPMEPRVPADIIADAARAVEVVKSIDSIVVWLKNDPAENVAERGDAIRGIFGRNRVCRLTDGVIGLACQIALIETLLMERTAITEGWSHLVEFREAPEVPPFPRFEKGGDA